MNNRRINILLVLEKVPNRIFSKVSFTVNKDSISFSDEQYALVKWFQLVRDICWGTSIINMSSIESMQKCRSIWYDNNKCRNNYK